MQLKTLFREGICRIHLTVERVLGMKIGNPWHMRGERVSGCWWVLMSLDPMCLFHHPVGSEWQTCSLVIPDWRTASVSCLQFQDAPAFESWYDYITNVTGKNPLFGIIIKMKADGDLVTFILRGLYSHVSWKFFPRELAFQSPLKRKSDFSKVAKVGLAWQINVKKENEIWKYRGTIFHPSDRQRVLKMTVCRNDGV